MKKNSDISPSDPLNMKFIRLLSDQGITGKNLLYEPLNELFVQIRQSLPDSYNDFKNLIQNKPLQYHFLCSGISDENIEDLTFAPDIEYIVVVVVDDSSGQASLGVFFTFTSSITKIYGSEAQISIRAYFTASKTNNTIKVNWTIEEIK